MELDIKEEYLFLPKAQEIWKIFMSGNDAQLYELKGRVTKEQENLSR